MDKQRDRFINYLKNYKKEMKKKILIDKLILFGSRSKGNYNKWSDFDLVVVSEDFIRIPWEKRQNKLSFLWDYAKYEGGADFLCYTPKEFEKMKNKICIVRKAVKEGIEI